MIKDLEKITDKKEIERGGIPLCYDDEAVYLDNRYGHTLVIGATGSGKTQTVTLPKIYTSIYAGENIIIDDQKGEVYERVEKDLKENNYKLYKIDFSNFNGNKWNALKLAYSLYKNNNIDDSVMIIEKVAYYIFTDNKNDTSDPFWINTVKQLFTGTILYIMEKEDKIPTIKEVYDCATNITIEDFNKLNNSSPAKSFLKVTINAPTETKGSIYSVFNSKLMAFSYVNRINSFLEESDFELEDLLNDKVALFIIDAHNKPYYSNLVELFVEELCYICNVKNNNKRINIILDDFNDYIPINDFGRLLSSTRSINVEFTILASSLHPLSLAYGEISLEHIISQFVRIIYLYANDDYTLEKISSMCGNKSKDEKLLSTTELKLIKTFDAVVFKTRHLPFKTTLLPFYKYPKE
jgi:type IV secretory pathway TraG/TraD family ATPase VirD4